MTPCELALSVVALIVVCAVIWLSVDTWRLRGDLNHTRWELDQVADMSTRIAHDLISAEATLKLDIHELKESRSTTADLDVPHVDLHDEVDDAPTTPTERNHHD